MNASKCTHSIGGIIYGNDAFQEVDIVSITRSICKYAVTVRKREDLAETIKKAFYIAKTGKPGVVVVDLPKDIQRAYGSDFYPKEISIRSYKPNTSVHKGQIKKALDILNHARRPVFLVGGGVNIARAGQEMTRLAELTGVPMVTTIMGKGAIPTDHDLYVGNLGIHGSYAANSAISRCDVLFSIGTRFNDRITGKIEEFAAHAKVIHIDIETASISRNIVVDVPIVADAKNAICVLLEKAKPLAVSEWAAEIRQWKEKYPIAMQEEGLTPKKIIEAINRLFDDAVITTDVGQNQLWTTQFLALDEKKQLLTSRSLSAFSITDIWEMCGNGRKCFITDIIREPVCATAGAAKQAVISRSTIVRNIRLILFGLRKATGRKASVLQNRRR